MAAYLVRRLLQTAFLIFAITVILFFLLRLMPGDPALVLLGDAATPQALAALRARLGLDQPLPVQFAIFFGDLLQGDLGVSRQFKLSAVDVVLNRMPATIQLAGASAAIAIFAGVPLAVIATVARRRVVDKSLMGLTTILQATPTFWLGMVLVLVFAVQLRLVPSFGYGSLEHVFLPAITLSAWFFAVMYRVTRSAMLDVMDEEFIRTARSKGLRERAVLARHALRNALIPIVTVSGLYLGGLLGGAVVTETIFSWPGVGSLLAQAVFTRDYPVIQAGVLLVATVYALLNLLVDVLYTLIDPRIRYA